MTAHCARVLDPGPMQRRVGWNTISTPRKGAAAKRNAAKLSKVLAPVGGAEVGLTPCPHCKGTRWWDNRAAKRAGQYKRTAPDFKCVDCGYAIWPT